MDQPRAFRLLWGRMRTGRLRVADLEKQPLRTRQDETANTYHMKYMRYSMRGLILRRIEVVAYLFIWQET